MGMKSWIMIRIHNDKNADEMEEFKRTIKKSDRFWLTRSFTAKMDGRNEAVQHSLA